MPPAKKRKLALASEPDDTTQPLQHDPTEANQPPAISSPSSPSSPSPQPALAISDPPTPPPKTSDPTTTRLARFRALQARAHSSSASNLAAAAAESALHSTDPTLLASLSRKQALASHKLLKASTAAAGDDFERKRAWDWTVEESERWDKRMGKKERRRGAVAFQDYGAEAGKIYKRQVGEMGKEGGVVDVEGYEAAKAEAVRRAAKEGGVELVETEEGEVIAVDRAGVVFGDSGEGTAFIDQKPEKGRVDRLVADLKRAEEVRLRKRRERGREEAEGDVTFINEKNKQFNQKLARFYNKYTAEIRDSFERGTMI